MTKVSYSQEKISGLYPRCWDRDQGPESERTAYEALASALPPGWAAWHSLRLNERGGGCREGDFVIADPEGRALVLEVKGGAVEKREGRWLQNGRPLRPTPLDQARHLVGVLVGRLKHRHIHPPFIGHAVCFSDTAFETPPTQDDLQGRVLSSHDLPYLNRILPDMMRRLSRLGGHPPTPGWMEALHAMWCESWLPEMRLSCRAKAERERRLRLDETQFSTLESILENDRVLVTGGAGMGKTLLARELARREAGEGRRVLLLCFTDALGGELARTIGDLLITAAPVGQFAVRLLRDRGFPIEERYDPDFWGSIAAQARVDGLPAEDDLWDTVIVDEGQDMEESQWELIRALIRPGGRLWVFADPDQAFWEERRIPEFILEGCMKYRLTRAYRCPAAVQALIDAGAGREFDRQSLSEGLNQGVVRFIGCGAEEVAEEVGREIDRLIHDQGFREPDIAVISLRGLSCKESIVHRDRLGGRRVVRATDPELRDHIVCDTFLRYKGLERPAVIVTDLRFVEDHRRVRLGIAVSRAMGVLRVIAERDELARPPFAF